jgi:hypothetical protein
MTPVSSGGSAVSVGVLRIALAAAVLAVSACSQPPWTVSSSPEAITLRWYSDQMDVTAAQTIADRHCQSVGKTAALASDDKSGSTEVAEFRCR